MEGGGWRVKGLVTLRSSISMRLAHSSSKRFDIFLAIACSCDPSPSVAIAFKKMVRASRRKSLRPTHSTE